MADSDLPTKPLGGEPALVISAVIAVLTALASLLHIDAGAIAGINAAIVAVGAVLIRQRVTPVT